MYDIPADIAGILPIGHVTNARLRHVCSRFRALFPPIPVEVTAIDWYSTGVARTRHGDCVLRGFAKESRCMWMLVKYGGVSVRRQVTWCRHVWYGGTRGLNLGRYCRWTRDALAEIFGPTLAAAPIFFTEVPRRWEYVRDIDIDRAYCLGLIENPRCGLRRRRFAPGCIVSIGRRKYYGEFSEIFHRANGCVYIHVLASGVMLSRPDYTAALPLEVLADIIELLARPSVAATVSTGWNSAYRITEAAAVIARIVGKSHRERVAVCSDASARLEYLFTRGELYMSGNVAGLARHFWRSLMSSRDGQFASEVAELVSCGVTFLAHADPYNKMVDPLIKRIGAAELSEHIGTFVAAGHTALVCKLATTNRTFDTAIVAAMSQNRIGILRELVGSTLFNARNIFSYACVSELTASISFLSMRVDISQLRIINATETVLRAVNPAFIVQNRAEIDVYATTGAREWLLAS